MSSGEQSKAFAKACVPQFARAMRNGDFKNYNRRFDPDLPFGVTMADFQNEMSQEQDGLGPSSLKEKYTDPTRPILTKKIAATQPD